MPLKNQCWCQYSLLSHVMPCCFPFVMLFMIMNSYVTFWTSKDYIKFPTRDYDTEAFCISEFRSVLNFTEQVLELVECEGAHNFLQILHGISSFTWYMVDINSYFPNMLNYRYRSRFVAPTLCLTFIYLFFCRFYKVVLLALDIERNALPKWSDTETKNNWLNVMIIVKQTSRTVGISHPV